MHGALPSTSKDTIMDNKVQISPSSDQDMTMQSITTSMMINNQRLEKMHDQRTPVSEGKKTNFNKLHMVHIPMI
jgi:hypothetical protein